MTVDEGKELEGPLITFDFGIDGPLEAITVDDVKNLGGCLERGRVHSGCQGNSGNSDWGRRS
jgi:hypothetical protein